MGVSCFFIAIPDLSSVTNLESTPVRRTVKDPKIATLSLFVSFALFGAPGQAWLILQSERRLPCELFVQQVATRAAYGVIRRAEAPPSERASRSASEPVSASLREVEDGQPAE